MRIVIAGLFEYPEGSAAASRVRSFAQGFAELGHEVYVVSMNAYLKADYCSAENGLWKKDKDVNYCLICGQKKQHSRRVLSHLINHFVCLSNCGKEASRVLEELHINKPVDVMIGYLTYFIGERNLVSFSKKHKIPLLWDVNEWLTTKYIKGGVLNPVYLNILLGFNTILSKVDGIIAITSFLEKHFASKNIPVVRVPSFIDPEEFAAKIPAVPDDPQKEYQFTYLGRMDPRDGPMMIVKAIQEILNDNYRAKLNVIGTAGEKGLAKKVRDYVEADPLLAQSVTFWGRVSYEQLYERLALSDCFIFNRESGKEAECAFPTRLPEFLATGKPVIVSNVCDIAEYLEDDKDAIIIEADSVESLADGLKRAVKLSDGGESMGASGREKCDSTFNYIKCSQTVLDFIQEVVVAKN